MALYQVDIEKQFNTEFWTNRYILNAPSLDAARESGILISISERAFHTNRAFFTTLRTRTLAENDGVFVNVPIGQAGLFASNTSYLPLFNVCRVDFAVPTGRPSRKFYRLPVEEGMVNDEVFSTDILDAITTNLVSLIGTLQAQGTPLVDPQGQEILAPTVYTKVAMRQLRRGSKRRARPVLN